MRKAQFMNTSKTKQIKPTRNNKTRAQETTT